MGVICNKGRREVIYGFELSPAEQAEFDYLDWTSEDGSGPSGEFFRYKGQLYDLGEFSRIENQAGELNGWDGYKSDSFFSGLVVRYVEHGERVIVGRYIA